MNFLDLSIIKHKMGLLNLADELRHCATFRRLVE